MAQDLKLYTNLIGTVVHGNKDGRKLGFPTANLELARWYEGNGKVTDLEAGVYACTSYIPQLESGKELAHAGYQEKLQERELVKNVFSQKYNTANLTPYPGLLHYGPRSVFGETKMLWEVYIFDFDTEIYGLDMLVIIRNFIRPTQNFASLDDLVTQMKADEKKGRELLLGQENQ